MITRAVVAQVDAEPGGEVQELQESATGAWQTFVDALPRIGIAVAVLVGFIVVGRLLRPLVRARLGRHRTPSFARVFARLTSSLFTVVGILLALTIVFPSVRPVDVLASAGILTLAAGFAFQDILQNALAGILLLFRQPFRGGDQVEVGGVAGTVDEINIRETVITTFDGRRVLIPNAKVYTDVIRVQTGHERIRAEFEVGIAYEADMGRAREVAAEAIAAVDGVQPEPAPEVLVVKLGDSTIDLLVRFWCSPRQVDMQRTLDRAIQAVKEAFDAEGIDMPVPLVRVLAPDS